MTKRSETSQRRTIGARVSASQVAAMVTLQQDAPEVLAAMVPMVNACARPLPNSEDVAALAVVMAPAMWLARREESMPLVAVVSVAVRKAARTLAGLAREEREAVESGDVLVEAVEAGDVALTMGRGWCPSPEAAYLTTWRDALEAMVSTLPGEADRAWLAEAVAAWLALESSGRMEAKGRPITLAGAVPVVKGWKASEAAGKAARRAVLAALAAMPVESVEAVLSGMDVRPGEAVPHGANRVAVANGTGRHVAAPFESLVHSVVEVDANDYPARLGYGEAVGVRDVVRRVSAGEAARVESPNRGAVPVGDVWWTDDDGQERHEREAATSRPDDRPARMAGDDPVHLPVRAVTPSPRKRGGSGATGPTTPAHLTR